MNNKIQNKNKKKYTKIILLLRPSSIFFLNFQTTDGLCRRLWVDRFVYYTQIFKLFLCNWFYFHLNILMFVLRKTSFNTFQAGSFCFIRPLSITPVVNLSRSKYVLQSCFHFGKFVHWVVSHKMLYLWNFHHFYDWLACVWSTNGR